MSSENNFLSILFAVRFWLLAMKGKTFISSFVRDVDDPVVDTRGERCLSRTPDRCSHSYRAIHQSLSARDESPVSPLSLPKHRNPHTTAAHDCWRNRIFFRLFQKSLLNAYILCVHFISLFQIFFETNFCHFSTQQNPILSLMNTVKYRYSKVTNIVKKFYMKMNK